jgi:N-acetylated-alpha-linked acidic dipeptidase
VIARKAPLIVIIFVCFVAVGYFFLQNSNEEDLDDFAAELESLVQTSSVSENMEFLASKPHRAGTPENHRVGDRIISELKSMGAKVWTEQHTVSLPQPGKASLVLTAPSIQEIDFLEKPIDGDPYSTISANEPPFFAYVADTDVEGEVIYANFGDRQDYQRFKDQNISLKGKIALVRTQGSCRGMKQLVAEEEGLGALLLYTEPKDQGFKKPSYPQGPNIHPWVAQRGSMLKFFLYPGDPNTPIEDKKENTLPGVPALPITPVAGETILKSLEGSTIEEWKGWMNNSYRTGPGPGRVRLTYTSQNKQMQIRNIFSVLPGMNPGDPPLIVSTHYDAWVYGASDPASGTAVVLEVAKALSELQKKGWRPQRDILFAFWDAEEYGMIGSTRWVTDHLDQARRVGNVLYIDSVRGPMFRATVVPGMRGILDDVLRRFKDPNTGKSILDFHLAYEMPGFSDDTIPFSNLAGAPVAQLNYGIHYSMYHSIYDNLAWMKKFGDPGYAYALLLASSRFIRLH